MTIDRPRPLAAERSAVPIVDAIRLNTLIPIPLYAQLADGLEAIIAQSDLSPGHRLPTEVQIAHRLRVSRPTVHAAMHILMIKGLITQSRGRGTAVA